MFDNGPEFPLAHSGNLFDNVSFPGSFPSPCHLPLIPQLLLRIASQINLSNSNLYLRVFFGEIPKKAMIFHDQVFQLCTYLYILVMNVPRSLQPQNLCTGYSCCSASSPLPPTPCPNCHLHLLVGSYSTFRSSFSLDLHTWVELL